MKKQFTISPTPRTIWSKATFYVQTREIHTLMNTKEKTHAQHKINKMKQTGTDWIYLRLNEQCGREVKWNKLPIETCVSNQDGHYAIENSIKKQEQPGGLKTGTTCHNASKTNYTKKT